MLLLIIIFVSDERVPSFRAADVTREIDLIEEIARINGYDKIAPTLPNKSSTPVITLEERTKKKIHELMLSAGLNELVTPSLIGEPLLKQFDIVYDSDNAVKVEYPASEEFTMLRQTMAASLLNCMKNNYDNGQKVFWGYEFGKVYNKVAEADERSAGVKETQILEGIITGAKENSKWQTTGTVDFYTIKGIVDNLMDELGLAKRIKLVSLADSPLAETHKSLHPYRTGVMMLLGKRPEVIGYCGQINPELRDRLKMKQDAFLFKVDLDMVFANINESTPRYKKLPQFPEVQRDLAMIIPQDVSYADLEKAIKKGVNNNLFNGCEVFDIYQGEHVQDGYKSIACRIKLLDANTTLTDETIETQMANVRANLKKTFAELSFRE